MRVASTIGKVVIVTGASAGIGAAVAEGLARAGARVMLAARRDERLSALAERLRAEGGVVDYLATHVGDRGAMQRLADATVAAFGRIDVLVNNAGVMSLSTLAEGDVDAWDQMIDINLKGVLYGIAAVLPVMRRQNSGHIINLSSTMAHGGQSAGAAVYVATKAAVSAISEAFRQEAGPNIRSTIISPGAVTSELHDRIPDPKLRETIKDFYKIAVPASAIADAVLYSISQPAAVDINEIIIRPTAQEM
jgi:NADP-dependent 3-hydroxy acid dehydrogenase YdfG